MTFARSPLLPLVAVIALSACAGHPGGGGDLDQADAAARLQSLNSLDDRVNRVAYRLSVANVDLCPTTRRTAGWALHSANQYGEALRPLAQQRFGLAGDLPGVLAIAPGSPAAAAGVRPGDLIVRVGEATLSHGAPATAASFEGLAANLRKLDAALAAESPVSLTLRRDGEGRLVDLRPVLACGYEVQLDPSGELNARADGRRLFISTALAGFAQTDDELALILGHELAHHVLGHRDWRPEGGAGRASSTAADIDGGPGGKEQQADRVGLYLMARAGYDPEVAAPFWRRFGDYNWRVRLPQVGHASAGARARQLDVVAAEIAAKRSAGGDLRP